MVTPARIVFPEPAVSRLADRRRLAIVANLPTPYHHALFNRLAADPEINLRVFYLAMSRAGLAWDEAPHPVSYAHQFLENRTPARLRGAPVVGSWHPDLPAELDRFAPDGVVVFGFNTRSHALAISHCHRHGIALALRGDSNIHLERNRGMASWLRRMWLRRKLRQTSTVLSIGSANEAYWRRHGAREEQFIFSPLAVDNLAIGRQVDARRGVAPGGAVRFLYAGRLIARKGVHRLIAAFNALAEERAERVTLTIVGAGPEGPRLQALQAGQARRQTRWLGRQTHEQTINAMADADVFVHPATHEPWGLVVNEAMAAGLAVVADARVGAAIDLLTPDGAGVCFSNQEELFSALVRLTDEPGLAQRWGQVGRQRIANWSLERSVAGFKTFAQTACRREALR